VPPAEVRPAVAHIQTCPRRDGNDSLMAESCLTSQVMASRLEPTVYGLTAMAGEARPGCWPLLQFRRPRYRGVAGSCHAPRNTAERAAYGMWSGGRVHDQLLCRRRIGSGNPVGQASR